MTVIGITIKEEVAESWSTFMERWKLFHTTLSCKERNIFIYHENVEVTPPMYKCFITLALHQCREINIHMLIRLRDLYYPQL